MFTTHGGLPSFPWQQISANRRIGELDFNMPGPFVLRGDNLQPQVYGSG